LAHNNKSSVAIPFIGSAGKTSFRVGKVIGVSLIPKSQTDGFARLADTLYFENVNCCHGTMKMMNRRNSCCCSSLLQPQLSTFLSAVARLA
jgi:hypothetical protein